MNTSTTKFCTRCQDRPASGGPNLCPVCRDYEGWMRGIGLTFVSHEEDLLRKLNRKRRTAHRQPVLRGYIVRPKTGKSKRAQRYRRGAWGAFIASTLLSIALAYYLLAIWPAADNPAIFQTLAVILLDSTLITAVMMAIFLARVQIRRAK